ncbi:MAG TPA: hypothetical protein VKI45_01895 [Allosphingosinicella sp.]|nr:hypothetical protein [Allosphingosinicella sp.]
MSDFLDHLLAQVRPAAAAALEPRTHSRFEPLGEPRENGGPGFATESRPVTAPAPDAPEPGRRTAEGRPVQEPPAAPRRPRAEAEPAPLPARDSLRPEQSAAPPSPSAAAHAARAPEPAAHEDRERRPPAGVQAPAAQPGGVVRELVIRQIREETAAAGPAPATAPPPEPLERLAPAAEPPRPSAEMPVQPQRAPDPAPLSPGVPVQPQLAAAPRGRAAPPAPAPIVEVRIGRIEIHAPSPGASPAEPAPRPAAGRSSRLERFLARG